MIPKAEVDRELLNMDMHTQVYVMSSCYPTKTYRAYIMPGMYPRIVSSKSIQNSTCNSFTEPINRKQMSGLR